MKNPPDILNSKIKKIRIELPHYTFSHSSSGDSSHAFIGRERIRERMKKVIEDSPNEPGVYLIAGNRGVGKTSLISWVIKETSLKTISKFRENFVYLLLFLMTVVGTLFCLRISENPDYYYLILLSASVLFLVFYFILLCLFNGYWRKNPQQTSEFRKKTIWKKWLKKIKNGLEFAAEEIRNYIRNHNRLYLRINFGHKLKNEKDILRLITRTLSTEYDKYHRSFGRLFLWRIMAFGLLFASSFLFSGIVKDQDFYKTIKGIEGEKRQEFDRKVDDRKYLKDIFYKASMKVNIKAETNVKATNDDDDEILNENAKIETKVDSKIDTKIETKIRIILFALDKLVSDISYNTVNIPKYFLKGYDDVKFDKSRIIGIIFLRDYLFWLSFILMYLFCRLLFFCYWITPVFATHRMIMRRLRKLNSDIIHSTEREASTGIISLDSERIGPGIGIRAKKTRGIADAREIEKELQDILSDMQRIPKIMCRPSIVIVFDELDKVEPGDAGSEKENMQTKASLFSIDATRERQTEILKILSNMKYFLSSARAKFIFIAGREMFDIHLADVSERNNYIGSIFNAVILVPSFLTDHHTGKSIPKESTIPSLPEEFVCRRLFPRNYKKVECYNLQSYQIYLEKVVYKNLKDEVKKEEIVQKTIAILQQFIIYLAHVSKGAPKKMMQLFESFVEIRNDRDDKKNTLLVRQCRKSRYFLSFNYYKQYTLGIIAYLITPIFYRLAESNIKEYSDKLLVSSLRFVDFLFKLHKHSFSWKILDISPEMLEVNRAPELKSVVVDLLNYLSQVHINKSNFSLSEYKFDSLIANEIFAMAKTDEVFSALFSFSLDEMLPLKKHYQDLLLNTQEEYQNKKKSSIFEFIDAISSLQVVLGDLCYYNDELEEAEAYYKSVVQALRNLGQGNKEMTLEHFYIYVRNMLRLGMIYEKRKQYDFAYLTYGDLCTRIIHGRDIRICSPRPLYYKEISPGNYDELFKKMTYEGLKILYLPFIAKLQILELSHMGGITRNHLEQLDIEFEYLTYDIHHDEAKLLEAEFYSRVADILYYKNSDLKDFNLNKDKKNISCTACDYYLKALSTLLGKPDKCIIELLRESIEQLKNNYNMKFCTILARILSDWGNVFFSCDNRQEKNKNDKCYICDGKCCNTKQTNMFEGILEIYISYMDSESRDDNRKALLAHLENKGDDFKKIEIAFAMYTISSEAYRKANLYKRSACQIYKMLKLFKHYEIYNDDYIEKLSKNAIHYLWYANEDLNVLELNKRKKDFGKEPFDKKVPLQNLLVDSEITRIWITVKKLELKSIKDPKKLKTYYDMRITSPYKLNYSIEERIYRLWLKCKVNYKAYEMLIDQLGTKENLQTEINFVLRNNDCNDTARKIFGEYFNFGETEYDTQNAKIEILENLIAETIYSLIDIAQLTETMDETFVFTHGFLGSIHRRLSFWIRLYETYEKYKEKNQDIDNVSRIDKYLKQYLDEEWREQLSGYRENQRALSHYYKCLEMHNEGRAYHNMIDTMIYLRDDYNDRSDHFNIAEERHLILNGKVEEEIKEIKNLYNKSELYKVDNYYNQQDEKAPDIL